MLVTNGPTPCIRINGNWLVIVDQFCYLGSITAKTPMLDTELSSQIGKAANSFGKLGLHAWDTKYLTICTKVKICETCVLSSPLYGREAGASHAITEHKLNSFHICCLRKLLGITGMNKVPNVDILRHCHMVSLQANPQQQWLHWLDHVFHMDTNCLPQQTLYGEPTNAKCNRGNPRLYFTDACWCNLNLFGTDVKWEMTALRCQLWKQKLHNGSLLYERNWAEKSKERRSRSKGAYQTDMQEVVQEPCQPVGL